MKKIIHSTVDVYAAIGDKCRYVCSVRGGEVSEHSDAGHYMALQTEISPFDESDHPELFTELVATFDLGTVNKSNVWLETSEPRTMPAGPDCCIEFHSYRWINNTCNW